MHIAPDILSVFLRIIQTLCNFPITQEREDLKTTTYNNLKPDTILKNFWKNNEHFADLFNAALFNGSQVIKPEDLSEADTDVSSLLKFNNHVETIQRILTMRYNPIRKEVRSICAEHLKNGRKNAFRKASNRAFKLEL